MKKLRLLGLFFGLALFTGGNLCAQTAECQASTSDGTCCDQDGAYAGFPACEGAGLTGFPEDMVNSDADCGPVDDPACSIPIDGGLSLLALAGGGLATAAMRRRREEEEVAAQGAA